ncbi:unnamed protein product [Linum trigynum]|uniref:Uncharacterized protein n=1 Tax=Linum trigynum TaxID=586398 RepID=A0AAV2D250_9ROSI
MENTQHIENQVIEEISDSGKTDIVEESRKKRKSIDLPPAQTKNGNSTSASICKNLKKPIAVEIFTDKMPRKEHPVLGKNELQQDSRNKYDCSNQNQKGKQSKKCQKAKNNRHTDDGADTVIMVNSDDEKSSSDNDLPLSKILGDKKPPNKKSSSAYLRGPVG